MRSRTAHRSTPQQPRRPGGRWWCWVPRSPLRSALPALRASGLVDDDGRRAATTGGRSFRVKVGEDHRKILCVGQESNGVDMVRAHKVEPANREALHSSDPEIRNANQLTCPRRPRARHPLDRAQRPNSGIEEPFTEISATFRSVVAGTFDEIGLGQRSKTGDGHESAANARWRSSSMTSSVAGRASPDASPSARSSRNRRSAMVC